MIWFVEAPSKVLSAFGDIILEAQNPVILCAWFDLAIF